MNQLPPANSSLETRDPSVPEAACATRSDSYVATAAASNVRTPAGMVPGPAAPSERVNTLVNVVSGSRSDLPLCAESEVPSDGKVDSCAGTLNSLIQYLPSSGGICRSNRQDASDDATAHDGGASSNSSCRDSHMDNTEGTAKLYTKTDEISTRRDSTNYFQRQGDVFVDIRDPANHNTIEGSTERHHDITGDRWLANHPKPPNVSAVGGSGNKGCPKQGRKPFHGCMSPPPIVREGLRASSPFFIHSNYIVKDAIGQGTWGCVRIAVERSSGIERAVKRIPKATTQAGSHVRQEICFLKSLDHPSIVRLHETFEDYASFYLVMDYCRGGELFERLVRSKSFNETTAAILMRQILATIIYIHQKGIAHRDLKLENFLFLEDSADAPLKLIDFGLARRFNPRRQIRTKVGTLYYVAPEVLGGSYNEKCDIWSAGVILYVLLCGVAPFQAATDAAIVNKINGAELDLTSPSSPAKSLSPMAKELIRALLRKNPCERPTASQALQFPWFHALTPSILLRLQKPWIVPVTSNQADTITPGSRSLGPHNGATLMLYCRHCQKLAEQHQNNHLRHRGSQRYMGCVNNCRGSGSSKSVCPIWSKSSTPDAVLTDEKGMLWCRNMPGNSRANSVAVGTLCCASRADFGVFPTPVFSPGTQTAFVQQQGAIPVVSAAPAHRPDYWGGTPGFNTRQAVRTQQAIPAGGLGGVLGSVAACPSPPLSGGPVTFGTVVSPPFPGGIGPSSTSRQLSMKRPIPLSQLDALNRTALRQPPLGHYPPLVLPPTHGHMAPPAVSVTPGNTAVGNNVKVAHSVKPEGPEVICQGHNRYDCYGGPPVCCRTSTSCGTPSPRPGPPGGAQNAAILFDLCNSTSYNGWNTTARVACACDNAAGYNLPLTTSGCCVSTFSSSMSLAPSLCCASAETDLVEASEPIIPQLQDSTRGAVRVIQSDSSACIATSDALYRGGAAVLGSRQSCCDTVKLEALATLARHLVPRWRRFALYSQLKRAALHVIAQQLSDSTEVRELRDFFCALDLNSDGVLCSGELANALASLRTVSNLSASSSVLPRFGSCASLLLQSTSSSSSFRAASSRLSTAASQTSATAMAECGGCPCLSCPARAAAAAVAVGSSKTTMTTPGVPHLRRTEITTTSKFGMGSPRHSEGAGATPNATTERFPALFTSAEVDGVAKNRLLCCRNVDRCCCFGSALAGPSPTGVSDSSSGPGIGSSHTPNLLQNSEQPIESGRSSERDTARKGESTPTTADPKPKVHQTELIDSTRPRPSSELKNRASTTVAQSVSSGRNDATERGVPVETIAVLQVDDPPRPRATTTSSSSCRAVSPASTVNDLTVASWAFESHQLGDLHHRQPPEPSHRNYIGTAKPPVPLGSAAAAGVFQQASTPILAGDINPASKPATNTMFPETAGKSSASAAGNAFGIASKSKITAWKRLLASVSLDGSESLEYCGFLAASIQRQHYTRSNILKAAFRVFDRDNDGLITQPELRLALGWINPYGGSLEDPEQLLSGQRVISTTFDQFYDGAGHCQQGYTQTFATESVAANCNARCSPDHALADIYSAYDLNRDGALDFEEFCSALCDNPHDDDVSPDLLDESLDEILPPTSTSGDIERQDCVTAEPHGMVCQPYSTPSLQQQQQLELQNHADSYYENRHGAAAAVTAPVGVPSIDDGGVESLPSDNKQLLFHDYCCDGCSSTFSQAAGLSACTISAICQLGNSAQMAT